MAQTALTVNTFQLPNGKPVANGYIRMRLNQAGTVGDQLDASFVTLNLDSNGEIEGSPVFWPNAEISPANTYYIQLVYSTNGQLVAGPNVITV